MAPNQERVEEHHRDWAADTEEVEAEGAREELQQVLVTPPRTPGHVSPYVPSSPLEVAVQVHVEEANLDAL